MKTADEIKNLKHSWLKDPSWDIENTEGFEDHHDELLEFSNQTHVFWKEQKEIEDKGKMKSIGLDFDNEKHRDLFSFLINLTNRIEKLEDFINK